mgnify:CR=1 FL=1
MCNLVMSSLTGIHKARNREIINTYIVRIELYIFPNTKIFNNKMSISLQDVPNKYLFCIPHKNNVFFC